jgi:adenosylcobinamide-GDP ribazoletransferase
LYPLAGVLIGALSVVVLLLASQVFPPVVVVMLAVAAGLLLTGALHEDGFADCCDGLGGGRDRDRALEIMRDSRIGTYGALGLGMMLATKVVALTALPALFWVLIAGHAVSRASMVVVIARSTYARLEGVGRAVSGPMPMHRLHLALALGAASVLPLVVVLPPVSLLTGLVGVIAGHCAMCWLFERKLGGYTGDCLGAVQQVSEAGFYLGLLLWL